ncbi:MAG: hypothetical protein F6K30_29215 [Cyanothece sp. SIO2G6]|nr:hypothetical protein [Cyanothece sp. SIO2G6]
MADQYIWVVTDTTPANQDSPTPLKGDRANNALPNPFGSIPVSGRCSLGSDYPSS